MFVAHHGILAAAVEPDVPPAPVPAAAPTPAPALPDNSAFTFATTKIAATTPTVAAAPPAISSTVVWLRSIVSSGPTLFDLVELREEVLWLLVLELDAERMERVVVIVGVCVGVGGAVRLGFVLVRVATRVRVSVTDLERR